jgi:hypothetical protein
MLGVLSERGGKPFDPPAIDQLRDLAGPHPLLLQIAAYHAFDRQQAHGGALDADMMAEVRQQFLVEAEDHWAYFWSILSDREQRLLALFPLAWQSDPGGVRRLEQAGLVRRSSGAAVPLSPEFAVFVGRQPIAGLLQAPPATLDQRQRLALWRGRQLELQRAEFDLLACLVAHAGEVVPHRALDAHVWHDDVQLDDERLKTTVKTLRRALGEDAGYIQNVRGIGYTFAVP